MKATALALLFVTTLVQPQDIPPEEMRRAFQMDAEKNNVTCTVAAFKPYHCVYDPHGGATTVYDELPDGKERATFCDYDKKCYTEIIDRPKKRTQDLNPPKFNPYEPEYWATMAWSRTTDIEGSAEYQQHIQDVFVAALDPCTKLKGVEKHFVWLGRVNVSGVLTKTYVNYSTPFSNCFQKKIKEGAFVGKPPAWNRDNAGFPIILKWEPSKAHAKK